MRRAVPGIATWATAARIVFRIAVASGCTFGFARYRPQIRANGMPR